MCGEREWVKSKYDAENSTASWLKTAEEASVQSKGIIKSLRSIYASWRKTKSWREGRKGRCVSVPITSSRSTYDDDAIPVISRFIRCVVAYQNERSILWRVDWGHLDNLSVWIDPFRDECLSDGVEAPNPRFDLLGHRRKLRKPIWLVRWRGHHCSWMKFLSRQVCISLVSGSLL